MYYMYLCIKSVTIIKLMYMYIMCIYMYMYIQYM